MTNDQVHEALIGWLSGILGMTVIKDRQGQKRPSLPYAMVDLSNISEPRERPSDIKSEVLDTLNSEGLAEIKLTPITELEILFLVFCYGENGDEKLRRLKSAFHLSQVQEPLVPGIVIHEVGNINRLPEFVNERWEARAQCNVVVRVVSNDGFVVDTIETHTPFDIQTMRERT